MQKYSKESVDAWIDHNHQVWVGGGLEELANRDMTVPDVAKESYTEKITLNLA